MQNYIQPGDVLDYTIPVSTTITSGALVAIGGISGVAGKSGVTGDVIPVHVRGVFLLTKKTSLAIAVGDPVYWDSADGKVSKTATHKRLGVAIEAADSNDTDIKVVLVPSGADAQAAVVAAVTTANGSDAATTQALANALKTSVNAILTALKDANIMASA